jgi:hypothetical protein
MFGAHCRGLEDDVFVSTFETKSECQWAGRGRAAAITQPFAEVDFDAGLESGIKSRHGNLSGICKPQRELFATALPIISPRTDGIIDHEAGPPER